MSVELEELHELHDRMARAKDNLTRLADEQLTRGPSRLYGKAQGVTLCMGYLSELIAQHLTERTEDGSV